MNNILTWLKALVEQGEAQLNCGDHYATFNKQMIAEARTAIIEYERGPLAIEVEKAKSTPMTIEEAFQLHDEIKNSPTLNNIDKMLGMGYITGYAGAMLGEDKPKTKVEIQKMLGGKTF